MQFWSGLWGRDRDALPQVYAALRRMKQRLGPLREATDVASQAGQAATLLNADACIERYACVPTSKSCGMDLICGTLVRGTTREARVELADIHGDMQFGPLPLHAHLVRVGLPDKPLGGDRPIGVMSNVYRTLVSCQADWYHGFLGLCLLWEGGPGGSF